MMNGLADVVQTSASNCPVCLDGLGQPHDFSGYSVTTATPCGHQFHTSCINTWLIDHLTCPVGRRVVTTVDVQPPAPRPSLPLVPGWSTMLCESAKTGDLATTQAILNRGGHVDAERNGDRTPFYLAAKYGQVSVALYLAQHGATSAKAEDLLGLCYLNGNGVEKNPIEACNWFAKAATRGFAPARDHFLGTAMCESAKNGQVSVAVHLAEQGAASAEAESLLGLRYLNGDGVAKNPIEACKWFTKAATRGYVPAIGHLGWLHKCGEGTTKDLAKALNLFQEAAQRGCAASQANLAYMLANGEGTRQDQVQAKNWFQQAASQGLSCAQDNLALCYLHGKGTPKNLHEAVCWFSAAANQGQGLAKAQCNLGEMLLFGVGVEKNAARALAYFIQSARQGFPLAQSYVDQMLSKDKNTTGNTQEAIDWFTKSARQGYNCGQHRPGHPDGELESTANSEPRSKQWLHGVAAQGFLAAQKDLANLYLDSETEQGFIDALPWFHKAAEQGDVEAQCALAWMYLHGKGTSVDRSKALSWFAKAAAQRHIFAMRWLVSLYLENKDPKAALFLTLHCFLVASDTGQEKPCRAYLQGPPVAEIPQGIRKYLHREPETTCKRLAVRYLKEGQLTDKLLTALRTAAGNPGDILENLSDALLSMAKNSNINDAQVLNLLATMYFNGEGTAKDIPRALKCYRQAAISGLVSAQGRLGIIYLNGEGTRKNRPLAMSWLRKAARRDDGTALRELARLHLEGKGTKQDPAMALTLCQRAAKQGDAIAQGLLGRMHLRGIGTDKDPQTALLWLNKASAQEDVQGLYTLGRMLQKGRDTSRNLPRAYECFYRAAMLGHAPSQVSLGTMYWQGLGTPKRLGLALTWLRKASNNGSSKAPLLLARIVKVINSDNQQALHISGSHLPRCGFIKHHRRNIRPASHCPENIYRRFYCKKTTSCPLPAKAETVRLLRDAS